jgi:hypothetical protein
MLFYLPLLQSQVYMDVAIDGQLAGRIEAVLFMKESPLAAENMRQFCTGVTSCGLLQYMTLSNGIVLCYAAVD